MITCLHVQPDMIDFLLVNVSFGLEPDRCARHPDEFSALRENSFPHFALKEMGVVPRVEQNEHDRAPQISACELAATNPLLP